METFGEIFITIFGLFWVLVTVVFVSSTYDEYVKWRRSRNNGFSRCSDASEDFLKEKENIISIIQERKIAVCLDTKETNEVMDEMKDSSEFASLVRCAHYAGYHVSFEQNERDWSSDPEYLDPNVFKTDMGEAAALREERQWNGYKRYFDPPMSQRDRMLNRNSL